MYYKDNWDNSKKRLEAFWKGEIVDRCCFSVVSHRKGSRFIPEAIPQSPEDKLRYWTDGEWILKRHLDYFENSYFGGEATPQIFINLGAGGHAGFFKNMKYQFEETVWFFPGVNDWDKDELEFDPESFLYKKTIELAKYYTAESKGRYFVSMPDTSGNADALAHLRGSENLLVDLVTDEERVQEALGKIQEVWLDINQQVYDIVKENNEGGSAITWLDTWAPGRHAQMQCDLSVMISPYMFEKFIMPELRAQSEWMDNCLYHLDGMEQVRHLDMLLSLERLKVIQWTCVVGQPSPLEFIPILKKIQAAGKGVLIRVNPDEVEPLMEQLSSKGLYLVLRVSSEDEAKEIEKKIIKLTHE